jgi:hypothetical protein
VPRSSATADTLLYGSPGENAATPTRPASFPDMDQILANNTNAETGECPRGKRRVLLGVPAHCRVRGLRGRERQPARPALPADRARRRPGGGGVNNGRPHSCWPRTPGRSWSRRPTPPSTTPATHVQTVTWDVATRTSRRQYARREDQPVRRRRPDLPVRAGGEHAQRRRGGVTLAEPSPATERACKGRGGRQRLLRRRRTPIYLHAPAPPCPSWPP